MRKELKANNRSSMRFDTRTLFEDFSFNPNISVVFFFSNEETKQEKKFSLKIL